MRETPMISFAAWSLLAFNCNLQLHFQQRGFCRSVQSILEFWGSTSSVCWLWFWIISRTGGYSPLKRFKEEMEETNFLKIIYLPMRHCHCLFYAFKENKLIVRVSACSLFSWVNEDNAVERCPRLKVAYSAMDQF